MRYPEQLIGRMRDDLTQYGIEEARTPEAVDQLVSGQQGTLLMVVNSVCGCAAGKARPGVGLALEHGTRPDKVATVFAGGDVEATNRLRELTANHPPSSPSMYLFQDGKVVWVMPRIAIERREAPEIAKLLTEAFDQFCTKATAN